MAECLTTYTVDIAKSKAVDKLQGNEREWISINPNKASDEAEQASQGKCQSGRTTHPDITKGTSQWEGWGTALKPALEPITVARKPLGEKTVAENCLKWGVGGINIDGCRIENTKHDEYDLTKRELSLAKGISNDNSFLDAIHGKDMKHGITNKGRFPANLIHDGSDEVVGLFPQTKTNSTGKNSPANYATQSVFGAGYKSGALPYEGDSGSAARFFYCAKASKRERNIGCEGLELTRHADRNIDNGVRGDNPRNRTNTPKQNFHPTVKPVALMRYLCRLITPKGGVILDPYMGSGTTGIGAKLEGFDFIGIEREEEYIKIAQARIEAWEVDEQLELSKLKTK